jgi:hypothetical protein
LKNTDKKKIMAVFLVSISVIAAVAAYAIYSRGAPEAADREKFAELYKKLDAVEQGKSQLTTRPDYLPDIYFAKVNASYPFPADFYQKRLMYKYGMLTDMSVLTDDYWKQPEWDPVFETIGINLIVHPPWENMTSPRYGAWGLRINPPEWAYKTNADQVVAYTFISSDWLVQTYQGIRLSASFPEAITYKGGSFTDGTNAVTQGSDVGRYFTVRVETQDCDTCELTEGSFVLTSAYPQINPDYKRRVKLTVDISPDTPPGKYAVSVTGNKPTQAESEQYYLKYGLMYTPNSWNVGAPYFNLFIEYK